MVTIKFDTSKIGPQAQDIPTATAANDGVMSAAQASSLASVVSSAPLIPATTDLLVNTVARNLVIVDMTKVPDLSSAFIMTYSVECSDGTNSQIQSGQLNANLARTSSGAYTSNTGTAATTNTVTSGTLVVSFSWDTTTNPNQPALRITVTSSLTPTVLKANFYVAYATHPSAISVAP